MVLTLLLGWLAGCSTPDPAVEPEVVSVGEAGPELPVVPGAAVGEATPDWVVTRAAIASADGAVRIELDDRGAPPPTRDLGRGPYAAWEIEGLHSERSRGAVVAAAADLPLATLRRLAATFRDGPLTLVVSTGEAPGTLVVRAGPERNGDILNRDDAPLSKALARVGPEVELGFPFGVPCAVAPDGMRCVPGAAWAHGSGGTHVSTYYIDLEPLGAEAYHALVEAGRCSKGDAAALTYAQATCACAARRSRVPTHWEWDHALSTRVIEAPVEGAAEWTTTVAWGDALTCGVPCKGLDPRGLCGGEALCDGATERVVRFGEGPPGREPRTEDQGAAVRCVRNHPDGVAE